MAAVGRFREVVTLSFAPAMRDVFLKFGLDQHSVGNLAVVLRGTAGAEIAFATDRGLNTAGMIYVKVDGRLLFVHDQGFSDAFSQARGRFVSDR
jgi:hypothetical protein